jgi:hypothetical protein
VENARLQPYRQVIVHHFFSLYLSLLIIDKFITLWIVTTYAMRPIPHQTDRETVESGEKLVERREPPVVSEDMAYDEDEDWLTVQEF